MKKQCKLILIGIILVLFIGWMVGSSSLITAIRNRGVEIVESGDPKPECGGFAFFEIGDVGETSEVKWLQVKDDIFDTVSGRGYFYCVSPEAVEETHVTLLFCSDRKTYEIASWTIEAPWVGNNYYINVDPTPQSYSMFEFLVSPLNLKKGDYEIYLKGTKEDGTVAAIVNTGYHLLRRAGKTEIVWNPSQEIERLTDYEGWADCGIESIRRDGNGDLLINGWGIFEGVNSDETSCILEIFDENGYVGTYTTLPRAITYICDYYESGLYYNCGFMAKIPQFSGTTLKMNIYVQQGDSVYACSYGFESDEDFSEVTSYERNELF